MKQESLLRNRLPPPRFPTVLLVLTLGQAALAEAPKTGVPHPSSAFVTSATMTPEQGGHGVLKVEGRISNFDQGARGVRVEIGPHREFFDFAGMQRTGSRYEYRSSAPDYPLIRTFTFDSSTKMFSLNSGSDLPNPTWVKVVIGKFVACEMIRFTESPKQWTFRNDTNPSYPCLIDISPRPSLSMLFADRAEAVTFYLREADIPKGGATLVQLDDDFNIKSTLCVFTQPGKPLPTSEYTCDVKFPAMKPGTLRLAAIPTDPNLRPNFSPSLKLNIATPIYTKGILALPSQVAFQASEIYKDQLARLKNAPAARKAAVEEIKKLPGVSDCQLAPDGTSIGIVLSVGTTITILTQSPETAT